MDQSSPTPSSSPEPQDNQVTPPTPPVTPPAATPPPSATPSPAPPPVTPPAETPPPPTPTPPTSAQPAWTPDMAVNPAPTEASSSYVSNPLGLIKSSWAAVKLNLGALLFPILLAIPFVVLLIILGLVGGFFNSSAPASTGLNVGLFIIGAVLVIALIVLMIALLPYSTIVLLAGAKGQKVSFKATFPQSRQLAGRFFVLAILTLLAVLGGLVLLIIPGLIFAAWFSFAPFIMVSENLGAIESMKRSKELVKGHLVETWGLLSLPQAASIIGIVPIIGPLVSLLFSLAYSAAPALRYIQLSELKATGSPAPKVHWSNYAVIVVSIISISMRPIPMGPEQPSPSVNTPTGEQTDLFEQ